jgi:hypothetical protein
MDINPRAVAITGLNAELNRIDNAQAHFQNVLEAPGKFEDALPALAGELGFDVSIHVLQAYWHDVYRKFHEAHNIRKFELVFLEIVRGTGRVRRIDPPITTRLVDVGREFAYLMIR